MQITGICLKYLWDHGGDGWLQVFFEMIKQRKMYFRILHFLGKASIHREAFLSIRGETYAALPFYL